MDAVGDVGSAFRAALFLPEAAPSLTVARLSLGSSGAGVGVGVGGGAGDSGATWVDNQGRAAVSSGVTALCPGCDILGWHLLLSQVSLAPPFTRGIFAGCAVRGWGAEEEQGEAPFSEALMPPKVMLSDSWGQFVLELL